MKNWVNSGIIFRDEVIKAIVDLAIWFTLHRMQSLIKFTCVEKNHMGCPESNCTPTFYSSEYKSTPTRCGSLCLLSLFFPPSFLSSLPLPLLTPITFLSLACPWSPQLSFPFLLSCIQQKLSPYWLSDFHFHCMSGPRLGIRNTGVKNTQAVPFEEPREKIGNDRNKTRT